jgi:hypothetical protein
MINIVSFVEKQLKIAPVGWFNFLTFLHKEVETDSPIDKQKAPEQGSFSGCHLGAAGGKKFKPYQG